MSQIIHWNFNRSCYQPGQSGTVSIWVQNDGKKSIFVSEMGIQFDWMKDEYFFIECGNLIPPHSDRFVSNIHFEIPQNEVGQKIYTVLYHLHEFDKRTSSWIDLEKNRSSEKHSIGVYPTPFYKAFISRGVRPEDRVIGDPIVQKIKEWGFNTVTIGIEKIVENPENISPEILNEIQTSDCLIAIATGRYIDAFTGLWRTLEWLHGEVGIAYGVNKPILILKEDKLVLDGLPASFSRGQLPFNPNDDVDIQNKLSVALPYLRDAIATKRSQEFWSAVGKAATGIGTVIAAGIAGYAIAKRR